MVILFYFPTTILFQKFEINLNSNQTNAKALQLFSKVLTCYILHLAQGQRTFSASGFASTIFPPLINDGFFHILLNS